MSSTEAAPAWEPAAPAWAAGGDGPELGTVEDSGADCPVPELPAADQLSAFAKHHDPFAMLDGTRITKKAEWRCRRAEIKAQVEQYESGPKPAVAPEDVSARFSGNTPVDHRERRRQEHRLLGEHQPADGRGLRSPSPC